MAQGDGILGEPRFVRPIHLVQGEDEFKDREVGITHPDTPAFVRLKDNGDIEIVAGEGLAMVFHKAKKSITLVADSIKFLTRAQGGLRWNQHFFNERAGSYNEPTLIEADDQEARHIYRGVEYFLYDDDESEEELGLDLPEELVERLGMKAPRPPDKMVNDPETGEQIAWAKYLDKYGRPPRFG